MKCGRADEKLRYEIEPSREREENLISDTLNYEYEREPLAGTVQL